MGYNATVRELDAEGNIRAHFVADVAELNGRWQMLRANGLQCTGFEDKLLKQGADIVEGDVKAVGGDAAYDFYWRVRHPGLKLQFALDKGRYYRNLFAGERVEPQWIDA